MNKFGLREPNTLAYGMCDSPTGLLVFVLKGLRLLGPRARLTPDAVINLTQLAWLPGPEYAMRFWAHCAMHREDEERKTTAPSTLALPKVAITVFLGRRGQGDEGGENSEAVATEDIGEAPEPAPAMMLETISYVPPAWGKAHYDVVHSQRTSGEPGLLAWERPEVIVTGVRALATEVLKVDDRLKPPPVEEPATALLEQIVVQTDDNLTPATPQNDRHDGYDDEDDDDDEPTPTQAAPRVSGDAQQCGGGGLAQRELPVIEEAADEGHLQMPRRAALSDGASPDTDTLVANMPPPTVARYISIYPGRR